MLFCIGLCSSVSDYVLLYCIMPFSIGLCSSVLYYALLYRIVMRLYPVFGKFLNILVISASNSSLDISEYVALVDK